MTHESEKSASGAPIYRHQEREREFELAIGDEANLALIGAHIEKYVGTPEMVFHEMISNIVHIDIHWVKPTSKRNYHTLVTSGMSDLAMNGPSPTLNFAELMICLPPTWPISEKAFQDERNYWPIRLLKVLSRFPHEYHTWLFASHTLPNNDPPEPYALNTKLCCAMLFMPLLFDPGFYKLNVSPEKTIHFLSLIPLYREEMDFKLNAGFDPLLDKLEKIGVNELLDINRKNSCQKRWWWF
jgi:hypothetical protein